MKKIFLIAIVAALSLSACDDETSKDVSYITTYATMKLNDSKDLFWQMNTPFVDPGCTAFEGTINLADKVVVTSDVNATEYGKYSIAYSAKNSDGFTAGISRNVYVCETAGVMNGVYTSNIVRDNAGTVTKRGPFKVVIYGVADGNYAITDLIGGWYDLGGGYGPTYAGSAVIKLNVDNTLSVVSADAMAWGYPCEFTSGTTSTYDPIAKTLVLHTNMEDLPDMKFTVTLTKN